MAFNNVGNFTIAANASYRSDNWLFPSGNGDQGAQYFSAQPIDPFRDAQLVISDQSKTLESDDKYYYGFRIANYGPLAAHYSVQGGGFN